jgi:hypothetical protein
VLDCLQKGDERTCLDGAYCWVGDVDAGRPSFRAVPAAMVPRPSVARSTAGWALVVGDVIASPGPRRPGVDPYLDEEETA